MPLDGRWLRPAVMVALSSGENFLATIGPRRGRASEMDGLEVTRDARYQVKSASTDKQKQSLSLGRKTITSDRRAQNACLSST